MGFASIADKITKTPRSISNVHFLGSCGRHLDDRQRSGLSRGYQVNFRAV